MIKEGLSYDDVLLVPKYSEIESRSTIDLSVQLSKGFSIKFPIIPANMKTICDEEMATYISDMGGMAIVHRFMPIELQLEMAVRIKNSNHKNIGFSVGVKPEDKKNVDLFVKEGVKILCIDIAHGHSKLSIDMCKYISSTYPDVFLIAGNVATGVGARDLWLAGADAVKVGVGPGSLCTTRIETGNGVPQLTALMDVVTIRRWLKSSTEHLLTEFPGLEPKNLGAHGIQRPLFIIADGGIKNAGDCVKALCYADVVMAGNLFSGTDQAPGNIIELNGHRYKSYVGSSTHKTNHIEGVKSLVPYKGGVDNVLKSLFDGIRSGLSYQGVSDLISLKKDPQFVKISAAGMRESMPHDVMVIK